VRPNGSGSYVGPTKLLEALRGQFARATHTVFVLTLPFSSLLPGIHSRESPAPGTALTDEESQDIEHDDNPAWRTSKCSIAS